ncbi:MAG: methylenetetrahydrofolate reductase [Alphaproteobacteria bacterium]|nr:methylenetetrahydrofolate reductase [Alphaproteobacteria bacterium]
MPDKFSSSALEFSLEVFPPKTPAGMDRLMATVDAYTALKPAYLSVTFGAGGSSSGNNYSRRAVKSVFDRTHLPVAAHLTCANKSQAELNSFIDAFWDDGIRHIIALRGDILATEGPYQPHPEGYPNTADFIAGIKKRRPEMKISVAGYPETHPESPSEKFDLDHLKRKVDAGADEVLTQFFFDPSIFLKWRDRVTAHGIDVPIVPGLLPLLNFPKTVAMAEKCNASVPAFLHTMFDGVEPDSTDHKLLAMNVLSHQITRLIEHGVTTFHFYTMNETLLTKHLCTWLRSGF